MRRSVAAALTAFTALLGPVSGCEGGPDCQENVGAQTLDERVEVIIADQPILAELADDAVERERGWRKRACDRDAILLVPDQPQPLPVWGCELVSAIDVIGVHGGSVVFVESLAPCGPPCGGCPTVGDDIVVDGVLETLPGTLDVSPGDPGTWP